MTTFSKFFHSASSKEKKKVFIKVIKGVVADQKKVMEIYNVLSLFDGISCGQQALKELNIPIEKYYSSEIDKYAISITQYNFPNTIQLGDITKWREWDIDWSEIDLIQGGSPCQGFSFAGKQLNFEDSRSKLFFVFVDILNHIKEVNPNVKFLLENVRMKQEYQDVISEKLGIKPIKINSALVSAQNRVRFYWTNLGETEQPEDRGILLKDILEDTKYGILTKEQKEIAKKNCKKKKFKTGNSRGPMPYTRNLLGKSLCLVTSCGSATSRVANRICIQVGEADIKGYDSIKRVYSPEGKSPTITTMGGGHREPKVSIDKIQWRKLTPLECERLQTLPDNYTAKGIMNDKEVDISNFQRYKALGNGWTIEVIKHILKLL